MASSRREARQTWKWFTNSQKPAQVNLFHDSVIRVYSWNDLKEVLDPIHLNMDVAGRNDFALENIFVGHESQSLIFKYKRDGVKFLLSMSVNCMDTYVAILPFCDVEPPKYGQSIEPTLCFPVQRARNCPEIDAIIGSVAERDGSHSLLFLTESGWICSVTMDNLERPQNTFKRHFFVPLTWLGASTKLMVQVTERRDVIFVMGEEIAVVQNGLENVDMVSL